MSFLQDIRRQIPAPLKDAVKGVLYPPLLPEGQPAPAFRLRDQHGQEHVSGGRWQVLCFYPGDETPGCTRQLQDLEMHIADLHAAGAEVYGINPADADSHRRFAEKHGFSFPLLVDEGGEVARAFGCRLALRGMIARTVYLLDPEGIVRLARRGAPPAMELLQHIPPA